MLFVLLLTGSIVSYVFNFYGGNSALRPAHSDHARKLKSLYKKRLSHRDANTKTKMLWHLSIEEVLSDRNAARKKIHYNYYELLYLFYFYCSFHVFLCSIFLYNFFPSFMQTCPPWLQWLIFDSEIHRWMSDNPKLLRKREGKRTCLII